MRLSRLWFVVTPFLRVSAAPTDTGRDKPPAFFLAGDSTTAVNGGWGNGLLATLRSPAWGINIGQSGATTVSYQQGGNWTNITTHVEEYAKKFDTYVTVSVSSSWGNKQVTADMPRQFGHNDQKSTSNVTFEEYQDNLIKFAEQVKSLGGTPVRASHIGVLAN
jgi:hypothetical protein